MKYYILKILLVACLISTGAAAGENVLLRTFIHAVDADDDTDVEFDPSSSSGIYAWQTIFEDLFESLVWMNNDDEFVPGAAERWFYSDDGMILMVELKPDRIWSDGVPVTAEDFVFTLERMRDAEFAHSAPGYLKSAIVGFEAGAERFGVKALSPLRLQIEMTAPYAIDEVMLSESGFVPLPRHKAPVDGPVSWSNWADGVTNGAFTLASVDGKSITMKRNPKAPATLKPEYDEVVTTIRNWSDAAAAFLSGEVDYLFNIPERQLSWFVDRDIKTIHETGRVFYFALNSEKPELQDKRVRRALRLSVNREDMIKQLFPGFARPAYSIIPEGVQGYEPHRSLITNNFSDALAEARGLMKAAGYGPDNRLEVTISSNANAQHQNIGEFLRFNWSEIYVDATLDMGEEDFKAWFARFSDGDYMIGRRSWNAGRTLMRSFMDVCKPLADPRCGYYDSAEYGALMDYAYAERNLERSRELFQEADRMLIEADVIVPLFHGIVPVALSNRVKSSGFTDKIRRVRAYELQPANIDAQPKN